jgi:hypothetical protein
MVPSSRLVLGLNEFSKFQFSSPYKFHSILYRSGIKDMVLVNIFGSTFTNPYMKVLSQKGGALPSFLNYEYLLFKKYKILVIDRDYLVQCRKREGFNIVQNAENAMVMWLHFTNDAIIEYKIYGKNSFRVDLGVYYGTKLQQTKLFSNTSLRKFLIYVIEMDELMKLIYLPPNMKAYNFEGIVKFDIPTIVNLLKKDNLAIPFNSLPPSVFRNEYQFAFHSFWKNIIKYAKFLDRIFSSRSFYCLKSVDDTNQHLKSWCTFQLDANLYLKHSVIDHHIAHGRELEESEKFNQYAIIEVKKIHKGITRINVYNDVELHLNIDCFENFVQNYRSVYYRYNWTFEKVSADPEVVVKERQFQHIDDGLYLVKADYPVFYQIYREEENLTLNYFVDPRLINGANLVKNLYEEDKRRLVLHYTIETLQNDITPSRTEHPLFDLKSISTDQFYVSTEHIPRYIISMEYCISYLITFCLYYERSSDGCNYYIVLPVYNLLVQLCETNFSLRVYQFNHKPNGEEISAIFQKIFSFITVKCFYSQPVDYISNGTVSPDFMPWLEASLQHLQASMIEVEITNHINALLIKDLDTSVFLNCKKDFYDILHDSFDVVEVLTSASSHLFIFRKQEIEDGEGHNSISSLSNRESVYPMFLIMNLVVFRNGIYEEIKLAVYPPTQGDLKEYVSKENGNRYFVHLKFLTLPEIENFEDLIFIVKENIGIDKHTYSAFVDFYQIQRPRHIKEAINSLENRLDALLKKLLLYQFLGLPITKHALLIVQKLLLESQEFFTIALKFIRLNKCLDRFTQLLKTFTFKGYGTVRKFDSFYIVDVGTLSQNLLETDKPFWLFMTCENSKAASMTIYLWPYNTKVEHDIYNCISKLVLEVNQYVLLKELMEKRYCSRYLITPDVDKVISDEDEEEQGDLNRNYSGNDLVRNFSSGNLNSSQRNTSNISLNRGKVSKFSLGQFECPLLDTIKFPLYWRVKPMQALNTVTIGLGLFAISNRINLFVYEDSKGSIFYMRLKEEDQEDESPNSPSGSVSVSQTSLQSPLLNSGSSLQLALRRNNLLLYVYGLTESIPIDINTHFSPLIESKLESLNQSVLSTFMSRNSTLRYEDYENLLKYNITNYDTEPSNNRLDSRLTGSVDVLNVSAILELFKENLTIASYFNALALSPELEGVYLKKVERSSVHKIFFVYNLFSTRGPSNNSNFGQGVLTICLAIGENGEAWLDAFSMTGSTLINLKQMHSYIDQIWKHSMQDFKIQDKTTLALFQIEHATPNPRIYSFSVSLTGCYDELEFLDEFDFCKTKNGVYEYEFDDIKPKPLLIIDNGKICTFYFYNTLASIYTKIEEFYSLKSLKLNETIKFIQLMNHQGSPEELQKSVTGIDIQSLDSICGFFSTKTVEDVEIREDAILQRYLEFNAQENLFDLTLFSEHVFSVAKREEIQTFKEAFDAFLHLLLEFLHSTAVDWIKTDVLEGDSHVFPESIGLIFSYLFELQDMHDYKVLFLNQCEKLEIAEEDLDPLDWLHQRTVVYTEGLKHKTFYLPVYHFLFNRHENVPFLLSYNSGSLFIYSIDENNKFILERFELERSDCKLVLNSFLFDCHIEFIEKYGLKCSVIQFVQSIEHEYLNGIPNMYKFYISYDEIADRNVYSQLFTYPSRFGFVLFNANCLYSKCELYSLYIERDVDEISNHMASVLVIYKESKKLNIVQVVSEMIGNISEQAHVYQSKEKTWYAFISDMEYHAESFLKVSHLFNSRKVSEITLAFSDVEISNWKEVVSLLDKGSDSFCVDEIFIRVLTLEYILLINLSDGTMEILSLTVDNVLPNELYDSLLVLAQDLCHAIFKYTIE